jgi:hypothetical protein
MTAGVAIRAAIGLGINMRNDSKHTLNTSKEIRYRVWWSLYVLENLLSAMTGRPSSIRDYVCTAPLPVPFEEKDFHAEAAAQLLGTDMQKSSRSPSTFSPYTTPSTSAPSPLSPKSQPPDIGWVKNVPPNDSLYFLHFVQLTRITQGVLDRLYAPKTKGESWPQIGSAIVELDLEIKSWHCRLPGVFDFSREQRDQTFIRQRLSLGFFYYGTRIMINRPCLCRRDRKKHLESRKLNDFNRTAAALCIESAQAMLSLIPDEPNAVGLNKVGPWWCVLHFLMQATIVLMLELAFGADHMPDEAESILAAAKKAVRWFHRMSKESLAARRAWHLCDSFLRDVAPMVGGDAKDLPASPSSMPMSPIPHVHGHPIMRPTPMQPAYREQFPLYQEEITIPTIYTAYDECSPYNPSMGQLIQSPLLTTDGWIL